MTRIFLLHTTAIEDLDCATRIRQDLNLRGYTVYDEVQSLDSQQKLYQNSPQSALVGSAAVILLWSGAAAHSEWVWNAVRFAQQLKRQVLLVALDNSVLPAMLQGTTTILAIPPYDTIVAALDSALPPAQSNDPLLAIYEQAVDVSPEKRKAALEAAGNLFTRGRNTQQQPALLALLECLAQFDPITSVQERAKETLNMLHAKAGGHTPLTTSRPAGDPRFDAQCPQGHVSEFDKSKICKRETIYRGEHALTCKTCGIVFYWDVDCGGYR